jgi:hypothetical protein
VGREVPARGAVRDAGPAGDLPQPQRRGPRRTDEVRADVDQIAVDTVYEIMNSSTDSGRSTMRTSPTQPWKTWLALPPYS